MALPVPTLEEEGSVGMEGGPRYDIAKEDDIEGDEVEEEEEAVVGEGVVVVTMRGCALSPMFSWRVMATPPHRNTACNR